MTLRGKIVALVLGLTVAILAGLGLFLSSSWSGWSREAVERELWERAGALAARVELKRDGELELEDEGSGLARDPAHPFRLLGPQGLLASSGDLEWPPPGAPSAVVRDRQGRAWRVVSRTLAAGEREGSDEREERRERAEHRRARAVLQVQVAGVEAPFGALEERFRRGLLVALAAALILGGGSAALLAHLSLAPLRRLEKEVGSIGASSLDRRVDPRGLDRELGRLAGAFNDLLARLEEAMARQRQFVSRASHSLRTPTATILTRAEVALRRERDGEGYREALGDIAGAARESAALVSHLLTLSRLDERQRALQVEAVPLSEVAAELERLLAPRAQEAGVALGWEVPSGLSVEAERAALRELLEALLDNALHYTPRGGQAGVRARQEADRVELAVWDTGPGMSPEERAQALERFWRGSAGLASGKPGSGLGLAIVKAICDAHGWRVALGERAGGGLEVGITLRPAGLRDREIPRPQGARGSA